MTADAPKPDKDGSETPLEEEKVFSLPRSGTKTLTEIKEMYASIEEAIRDKNHLISATVSTKVLIGGTTFKLRTVRKREDDALNSVQVVGTSDEDLSSFLRGQIYVLALVIESVGETAWTTPTLSMDTLDTWLKSKDVVTKREFIQEWDASVVELLLRTHKELEMVKAIFLRENLKNL